MDRITTLPAATIPLLFQGGMSPQLQAIGNHLLVNLLFFLVFVPFVILLIFTMNRWITKDGRTNNVMCAIIGCITFPAIFYFALTWMYGQGTTTVLLAVFIG